MKFFLLVLLLAVQEKRTVQVENDIHLEIRVTDSIGSSVQEVNSKTSEKYSEIKSDRRIVTVLDHNDKSLKGKLFVIHKDSVIDEDGKKSDLAIGNWSELDRIASALKVIELKKGEEWEMELGDNTKLLGMRFDELPEFQCKIEDVTDTSVKVSLYLSTKSVIFSGIVEVGKKNFKPISYKSVIDFEKEQIIKEKQYDVNKRQLVEKEVGKIVIKSKTFQTRIQFSQQ